MSQGNTALCSSYAVATCWTDILAVKYQIRADPNDVQRKMEEMIDKYFTDSKIDKELSVHGCTIQELKGALSKGLITLRVVQLGMTTTYNIGQMVVPGGFRIMESSDLIQLKDVLDICRGNFVGLLEIKCPAGVTAHSAQMSHFVATNCSRLVGSKLAFGIKDSLELPSTEISEDQILRWMITVPEIYGADTTTPIKGSAIAGISRYIYSPNASVQKKGVGASNVKVFVNLEEAQQRIFGLSISPTFSNKMMQLIDWIRSGGKSLKQIEAAKVELSNKAKIKAKLMALQEKHPNLDRINSSVMDDFLKILEDYEIDEKHESKLRIILSAFALADDDCEGTMPLITFEEKFMEVMDDDSSESRKFARMFGKKFSDGKGQVDYEAAAFNLLKFFALQDLDEDSDGEGEGF